MPEVYGYRCDGCDTYVDTPDAHGWLQVQTMVYPDDRTPVVRRKAALCSLDCLVEWADDEVFADRTPEVYVDQANRLLRAIGPSESTQLGQYL